MTRHPLCERTLQLVEFQMIIIIRNRNTEDYESIMFCLEVGEINARAQTVYTRPSKIWGGEGLVYTSCLHTHVNFPNFQGKRYTLVLLRVTITYDDERLEFH